MTIPEKYRLARSRKTFIDAAHKYARPEPVEGRCQVGFDCSTRNIRADSCRSAQNNRPSPARTRLPSTRHMPLPPLVSLSARRVSGQRVAHAGQEA